MSGLRRPHVLVNSNFRLLNCFRKYPVGAVTLLVLNVHVHDPVSLKLTGSLKGKDVEEYLLRTENSDLTSK